MSDPILTLSPSPARRLFALAVFYGLAGLLAALALTAPEQTPWAMAVLIGTAAASAAAGEGVRRSSRAALHLTEDALVAEGGRVICRLDDIVAVDRGAFAFKPSNGFVLKLARPAPRGWAPGMWWRLGRRVGVGGVCRAAPAKAMAEAIAITIARRDT